MQGSDNALFEQVDIFISARDIVKLDTFSKSDPFAVFYL